MAKAKNLYVYKDDIVKLYKEGKSIREIATIFEVNKNSISRILKQNTELRPRSTLVGKEDEAYRMYCKGYLPSDICTALNINLSTLARYFARNYNIIINKKAKHSHLADSFEEDYKNGMSITDISKKYGLNRSIIHNYLCYDNVNMRTYSETSRLYYTDEDYFDVLDSKKAYKLGIILDIGRVYEATNNHIIRLSSKKYPNLILEASADITDKDESCLEMEQKSGVKKMTISSKKIYDKLIEYGINSKKISIPVKYIDDFFKGYFEGAATINSKSIYISINKPFSESIESYIENSLGIIPKKSVSGMFIRSEDSAIKFIKKFPEMETKINLYLENHPANTFWRNIKNKINSQIEKQV